MQVINQLLTAGLLKNILWSRRLERVQLMNKELPISLSLCSGNALVKLCRTFVYFGFLCASIALQPKLLVSDFKCFFCPLLSLSTVSLSLSNLLVTVRSQSSGTWSVIGVSAVTAYSTAPNDALGRLPRENSISSSHLSVVIIRFFFHCSEQYTTCWQQLQIGKK